MPFALLRSCTISGSSACLFIADYSVHLHMCCISCHILCQCDVFLFVVLQTTEFTSKRLTDDAMITITVTLVKIPEPDQCVQLYNIIFRRVMRHLKMQQVGRNYFDATRPVRIPQHKYVYILLSVYPSVLIFKLMFVCHLGRHLVI